MKFALLVIAAVLVPGLQTAEQNFVIQTRPLPLPESVLDQPEFVGENDWPEWFAEPEVESEAEENPCAACFAYMTNLIGQLAEAIPDVEPEVSVPLPVEPEVDIRPLPIPEEPEVETRPLPLPVEPEIDVRPLPIPEVETEGQVVINALPIQINPGVDIRPLPLPEATEVETEEEISLISALPMQIDPAVDIRPL